MLDSATIVIRNGLIAAHADLGMDTVPPGGDVGPTHRNPQVPQVPVKLHPEPEVDAHARHLSEAQRRIGRDAALLADKHAIQLPC